MVDESTDAGVPRWGEPELRGFYDRHRQRHEAGDWDGLGDLFTDDSSYFDTIWGWSHGIEAVRTFLHDSMLGLDDWAFPIHAVGYDVETGTVFTHWTNRLPGERPDGGHYDVPGVSVITYAGGGRMSRQMDLYDSKAMMRVIGEWTDDHDGALPYPAPS
jgi:hypothetical protein